MKKRGKVDSSRINFGLESLERDLHQLNSKKLNHNQKKPKKSSEKHNKVLKKAVKHIKTKESKLKKKIYSIRKEPQIEVNFPRPQKKQPEIPKEKVPTHLFKSKKKIIVSDEFKRLDRKFRYEFVFFFGLIIAVIGLFFESKINIFFIFGLSLIFLALIRYHLINKNKKKDQEQKEKEIQQIAKKVPTKKIEPSVKQLKIRKTNKTIAIFILIITAIVLISKAEFTKLPLNVLIFISTLITVAVILLLLLLYFNHKPQNLTTTTGEIDIKTARTIPIELRQLKMPETYFDLLVEIVNKRGVMTLSEVAKTFRITKQRAEEWANILSEHNLINLYYPPIGEPVLKKIIPKKEKEVNEKNDKGNS